MKTACSQPAFEFQTLGLRQVVAEFAGGTITSDAGGFLLREVEAHSGFWRSWRSVSTNFGMKN